MQNLLKTAHERPDGYMYEHECYQLFEHYKIGVPQFKYFSLQCIEQIPSFMQEGKKYVFKCHIPGCLHKSDIGGVVVNITRQDAKTTVEQFVQTLKQNNHDIQGILVVEQQDFNTKTLSNGEILLSAVNDKQFGPLVCFGLGGTAVEYLQQKVDDAQIFIPCFIDLKNDLRFQNKVKQMPIVQYLTGQVRGFKKQLEFQQIIDLITNLQTLILDLLKTSDYFIEELEINPCVVDIKTQQIVALDGVVKIGCNQLDKQLRIRQLTESLKPLFKTGLFFAPRTILLVGVSGKSQANPCNQVLNKLQDFNKNFNTGFQIYLLHPNETEIQGIKCYKSINDLKQVVQQIDLFVCGVAANQAVELLNQIIDTGYCNSVFVLSAGFGETEQGKQYEQQIRFKLQQIVETCQITDNKLVPNIQYSLINGANTLGYKFNQFINTIFIDSRKSSATDIDGNQIQSNNNSIAILCQSGAFMITRLSNFANKVAPRLSVSVGNQIGVSNVDFLEWLMQNDSHELLSKNMNIQSEKLKQLDIVKQQIQIFALYIEGLNDYDGSRLIALIQQIKQQNKMIIIYKAGRTPQGAHAAAGHTASFTGSYSTFQQLMESAGAILCDTLEEFEDTIYLAGCVLDKVQSKQLNKKQQIGIVTNAGFEKCCYADHLFCKKGSDKYLHLPDYSQDQELHTKLVEIFKKYKLSAVVDLDQIIDTTPTIPDAGYYEFCDILLKNQKIDFVVMSPVPETHMMITCGGEVAKRLQIQNFQENPDSFVHLMIKLKQEHKDKILIITIESGWKYDLCRETLTAAGIPVFISADRCARALINVIAGVTQVTD